MNHSDTASTSVSWVPTPAELFAFVAFAWFFWYLADGMSGALAGAAGVAGAYVLTRVLATVTHNSSHTNVVWIAAIVVLAIAAPFVVSGDFRSSQLSTAAYSALAVLGLNLLTGYTGQVSVGHSAFIGIGAYVTAILVDQWSVNILLAMAAGTGAAAFAGLLIGVPALRLSGPYLAVATVGMAVVFTPITKLSELSDYTGGVQGLALFELEFGPPVDWEWLSTERWHYFMSVLALGIGTLLLYNLLQSAAGRSFRAVRDSEVAAAAMGINVARTKLTAFMLSAAYAGFAGGLLFLIANRFVSPDSFTLLIAIEFLTAAAIGGMASIVGSLLGGFFLVFIYREGIESAATQTEGGSDRWLIAAGTLIALSALFGNRRARAVATTAMRRLSGPFAAPIVNLARLALAIVAGLVIAFLFRLATDDLLDVTLLRGAVTGVTLIIIILFLPGGLAGFIALVQALEWRSIGDWLVSFKTVPERAQPSEPGEVVATQAPGG